MNIKNIIKKENLPVLNLLLICVLIGFVIGFSVYSCTTKIQDRIDTTAPRPADEPDAEKSGAAYRNTAADLQSSFRIVARETLPSVATIYAEEQIDFSSDNEGENPLFEWFFGPGNEEQNPFRSQGIGSGFVVRRSGNAYFLITNAHVVDGAGSIRVSFNSDREYNGSLAGTDVRKDLALIRIDTDEDIPVVRMGDSDALQIGDWVIAVGSPLGLQQTVTAGIVSALGRRGGPEGNISDFIQTDASINQGNSGGPLLNLEGEVVGINTWITSQTGGSIGLGFSLPVNNIKKTIEDIITTGAVEYGWLGVQIGNVPQTFIKEMKLAHDDGAFIYHVFKNSPADNAGILPGDFLTALDDVKIHSSDELISVVADLKVGGRYTFSLIRGGNETRLDVVIGKREDEEALEDPSRNKRLWPGVTVYPFTEEMRNEQAGRSPGHGVIVREVSLGSPAYAAGLQIGDIITAINSVQVASLLDFYRLLNDSINKEIMFDLYREGKELKKGIIR
jgi:Do/DeqQ family serine protease